MQLMRPITALRVLATLTSAVLAAGLSAPKGSALAGFLTGAALGLSITIVVMAWSSDFESNEKPDSGETIQMNQR